MSAAPSSSMGTKELNSSPGETDTSSEVARDDTKKSRAAGNSDVGASSRIVSLSNARRAPPATTTSLQYSQSTTLRHDVSDIGVILSPTEMALREIAKTYAVETSSQVAASSDPSTNSVKKNHRDNKATGKRRRPTSHSILQESKTVELEHMHQDLLGVTSNVSAGQGESHATRGDERVGEYEGGDARRRAFVPSSARYPSTIVPSLAQTQAQQELITILLGQQQIRNNLALPSTLDGILGEAMYSGTGLQNSVALYNHVMRNMNMQNPPLYPTSTTDARNLERLALYFSGLHAGGPTSMLNRQYDPRNSLNAAMAFYPRQHLTNQQGQSNYLTGLANHFPQSFGVSGYQLHEAPRQSLPFSALLSTSAHNATQSRPPVGARPESLLHDSTHLMIPPTVPAELPVVLSLPDDDIRLSPYQCLLRKQVEAFNATADDVTSHARGRNKPISLHQVGIRCIHCNSIPRKERKRGAVYYPFSLVALYQATQNMGASHFANGKCEQMPDDIKAKFVDVLACKSTIGAGKHYWAKAARKIGLVDTEQGIRFIRELQQR